jgi:DNA processing protein
MAEADDRTPEQLDVAAHLAALAGLPGMGPARLGALLSRWPAPEAWQQVRSGALVRAPEVLAGIRGHQSELCQDWQRAARATDVSDVWRQHVAAGVTVVTIGEAGFPSRLVDDPEPPAVLFHQGEAALLDAPTVAIVGTRRCTRYGHDVAREMGATLADAGVAVVSGLALGIDAAAHQGALDAAGTPPLAVIGTGLDVVYPRQNRGLWEQVVASGAVFTEAPLGTPPEGWRFPARNRIIAGLADVVVVVESHAAGGSLYTVEEAVIRDRPVLAVPGPIRSPASAGTNRLLADGAMALCAIDDVFVALGLVDHPGSSPGSGSATVGDPTDPVQRAVLAAAGWEPVSLDQLATATGLGFDDLSLAIERLVASGHLDRRGAWWERVSGR